MSIFNQPVFGGGGGGSGSGGMRDEAERFAASLGLTRGTPQWGAAIRDFVMNAPSGASAPPLAGMQSGMPGQNGPMPGGQMPSGLLPVGPIGGGDGGRPPQAPLLRAAGSSPRQVRKRDGSDRARLTAPKDMLA